MHSAVFLLERKVSSLELKNSQLFWSINNLFSRLHILNRACLSSTIAVL